MNGPTGLQVLLIVPLLPVVFLGFIAGLIGLAFAAGIKLAIEVFQ